MFSTAVLLALAVSYPGAILGSIVQAPDSHVVIVRAYAFHPSPKDAGRVSECIDITNGGKIALRHVQLMFEYLDNTSGGIVHSDTEDVDIDLAPGKTLRDRQKLCRDYAGELTFGVLFWNNAMVNMTGTITEAMFDDGTTWRAQPPSPSPQPSVKDRRAADR
jgi:hypothetical protein